MDEKATFVCRFLGGRLHGKVRDIRATDWPPRIIEPNFVLGGKAKMHVYERVKDSNMYVFRGQEEDGR